MIRDFEGKRLQVPARCLKVEGRKQLEPGELQEGEPGEGAGENTEEEGE